MSVPLPPPPTQREAPVRNAGGASAWKQVVRREASPGRRIGLGSPVSAHSSEPPASSPPGPWAFGTFRTPFQGFLGGAEVLVLRLWSLQAGWPCCWREPEGCTAGGPSPPTVTLVVTVTGGSPRPGPCFWEESTCFPRVDARRPAVVSSQGCSGVCVGGRGASRSPEAHRGPGRGRCRVVCPREGAFA